MEAFYSLQGEGAQTGKAAYFLRIGGCDVGCYWCDVKESWNPDLHPATLVDDIIKGVLETTAKSVVLTGGEPLMYNLNYLCHKLKSHNIEIFLETSGAYELTGVFDWICLSPKRKRMPMNEIYNIADELKVIIFEEADLRWAEEEAEKVNDSCLKMLQPEWSSRETITPLIIDYILANPKWRISQQTHKYLRIP